MVVSCLKYSLINDCNKRAQDWWSPTQDKIDSGLYIFMYTCRDTLVPLSFFKAIFCDDYVEINILKVGNIFY